MVTVAKACEGCVQKYPARVPAQLKPGQRCKVCGWESPVIKKEYPPITISWSELPDNYKKTVEDWEARKREIYG